jgi:hypothetical protein
MGHDGWSPTAVVVGLSAVAHDGWRRRLHDPEGGRQRMQPLWATTVVFLIL